MNALLFPPPSRAIADLAELMSSGYLAEALYASLFRVVCGFSIAVMVGVALGAAMARIRLVNDLLDPLVELLRPISPLALFPLAILWFGISDGSKSSSSLWQRHSRSSSTPLPGCAASMPICSGPRVRSERASSR